jgi:hypothetical protein
MTERAVMVGDRIVDCYDQWTGEVHRIAIVGGKRCAISGIAVIPVGDIHTDGKPRRSGWSLVPREGEDGV